MGNKLGNELKKVRTVRGLSLKAVATSAEISPAYLQKLEGGEVQTPSPNILQRLSQVLEVPYGALMEAADYLMPGPVAAVAGSAFDHALSSEDLSDDERTAVAAFIKTLRDMRSDK